MPDKVLGTRERTEDEPTLAEAVKAHLADVERRGGQIKLEQVLRAKETVDAVAGPSPVFRQAGRRELEAAALGLARRLKGGEVPTDDDLNASLVMIMDAEDQRRILFEQDTGVRTPDPITGISSLDDPNALRNLALRTGVGADVSGPRSFTGNIRAFFDLP